MGFFNFTKKNISHSPAQAISDLFQMDITEALSKGKAIRTENGDYFNFTLEEYGYFTAQWSLDLTNGMLDTISKIPHIQQDGYTSLISKINNGRASGILIFMGLYSASFWVYAKHSLNFMANGESALLKLTDGAAEGFSDIQTDYPDKDKFVSWLLLSFSKFADAIEADFVWRNGKDEVYKTALMFFVQSYKPTNEFSVVDQLSIRPLIEFAPLDLFELIKDRIVRINDDIIRVRTSA